MLRSLTIRDFVIVEHLELEFGAGFTALTGETGAGKSILIDALLLLTGGRADIGMVRSGAQRAEVEAEFDAAALPALREWLVQEELEGDEGSYLVRRVLDAGGRAGPARAAFQAAVGAAGTAGRAAARLRLRRR